MILKEIQQAVDNLLHEQGAYSPLELLLAEGRLLYGDYEVWRSGEQAYLEDALFGDPEQVYHLLDQAADYAGRLGLRAESQPLTTWGDDKRSQLRFSHKPELERLFNTVYQRDSTQPQMDLFMDAAGTNLANDIVLALSGRDSKAARRLLDQLYATEPGNVRLGGLERLLEAAEYLDRPVTEPEVELEVLQQELLPLAEDLLDSGSRHYLAPQWRRLTNAFSPFSFNSVQPPLHSSFTAIQAEDWAAVLTHVEKEADWQRQPELLQRHIIACRRLRLEDDALGNWFILCWKFPDQAEVLGERTTAEWWRWWNEFIDLEPELPNREFPAWLLLQLPGLQKRYESQGALYSTEAPPSFRLLLGILSGPKGELDAETIEMRRRLKTENPALFEHYMRSQSVN